MKVIIHDLGPEYEKILKGRCDKIIRADGRYAPCIGCFACWTKHPAECRFHDVLHTVCRTLGNADVLVVISRNCYGNYSPEVKAILDRSIGLSTPMSTYRGKQMHHTLRYGKRSMLKVCAYGEFQGQEKNTWERMAVRNALNYGYKQSQMIFLDSLEHLAEIQL